MSLPGKGDGKGSSEARQGARGRRSLSELLEALRVALPWCAYHSLGQEPQYLIHYLPALAALDFPNFIWNNLFIIQILTWSYLSLKMLETFFWGGNNNNKKNLCNMTENSQSTRFCSERGIWKLGVYFILVLNQRLNRAILTIIEMNELSQTRISNCHLSVVFEK